MNIPTKRSLPAVFSSGEDPGKKRRIQAIKPDFSKAALIMIFLLSAVAGADSLDEARESERRKDYKKALELYSDWLEENTGRSGAAKVVLHAASLFSEASRALRFMSEYAGELNRLEAAPVYGRMAYLESALGELGNAALHYRKAAEAGGVQGESWFLESLRIDFSQGLYEETGRESLTLLKSENPRIREEAVILSTDSLRMMGKEKEALGTILEYEKNHSPISSPGFWLSLKRAALAAGDKNNADRAEDILNKDYTASVYNYISRGSLPVWESPGTLVGDRKADLNLPLQAGAFRNRESAADLRLRIEKDGFASWIEESGGLWRVMVNNSDGKTRERLLENGYETSVR